MTRWTRPTTTMTAKTTMTDRWAEAGSVVAGLLVAALGGWSLLAVTAVEPQPADPATVAVSPAQVLAQTEPSAPAVEPIAVDGVSRSVSDLLASRGFAERIDLTGELPESVLRVLEQNNAVLRVAEVSE